MDEASSTEELLDLSAMILIRCFFMGVAALLFWSGMLFFAGDLAYKVHSSFFPMSSQQFYSIHYTGILLTKGCVTLFFLFPYISIRLVQRKNRINS